MNSWGPEWELYRRLKMQQSLTWFALYTDIPGCPAAPHPHPEWVEIAGGPAAFLPAHIYVILTELQNCYERPFGRLLVMAPPGSAKSSYVGVLGPAWAMGRWPNEPNILTSYGSTLAEKHSKRAQRICREESYKLLWDERPELLNDSVKNWELSNGSVMFAAGIMAGLTGHRAKIGTVDDPVAGREEADSVQIRQKTLDGYQDDFLTRMKPDASLAIVQTRWHELDLSGQILPEDYDGRSGLVRGRDKLDWHVLNIPAKAEMPDDPLGRKMGEYLWTEYLSERHWQLFEFTEGPESARRWSSLYQQRPTPQGSGNFTREMFNWYEPDELPPQLTHVGASDFAVTKGGGDKTEHAVWGMDTAGNLWLRRGWTGQETTDKSIDAALDLVPIYKPVWWFNEGGVIDKAIRPAWNKQMRERKIFVNLQSIPSMQDKVAKCQSFRARAAAGCVYLPKGDPWAEDLVQQLCALPAGRYDDKADVAGLIGRAIDKVPNAALPPAERAKGIKPFTAEWLEYEPPKQKDELRYR